MQVDLSDQAIYVSKSIIENGENGDLDLLTTKIFP